MSQAQTVVVKDTLGLHGTTDWFVFMTYINYNDNNHYYYPYYLVLCYSKMS